MELRRTFDSGAQNWILPEDGRVDDPPLKGEGHQDACGPPVYLEKDDFTKAIYRSESLGSTKTMVGLSMDLFHNNRVFENTDFLDFHFYPVSGFQKDLGVTAKADS